MADRPTPGGNDDSNGFDWLYGSKGKARGNAPEPTSSSAPDDATRPVRRPSRGRSGGPDSESTRVMPTMPAPSSSRSSRSSGSSNSGRAGSPARPPRKADPSLPRPGQIAPTPGQERSGRGRRKRLGPMAIIALLLIAWVVYLIAVPIVTWNRVDKVDWEPTAGHRPDDQPGTTYLMVGSDSRAGLSKAERRRLHTGGGAGQRTDTIMLMHTGGGPNLLMSIPRDAEVDIPGHGTSKINAAFAWGGPKLLTRTVEQLTGIRVDSYVEIGMGGVAGVVDAVGGIEICPKHKMDDKLAGLHVKKGCQEADGTTALAYSRSRHASALSDLDRVQQQREVVGAIGKAVLSPWTFINPVRYWKLNQAVPDFFTFGEGTNPVRAGLWAMAMARSSSGSGLNCTVPLTGGNAQIDTARAKKLYGFIAKDKVDEMPKGLCTPSGLPKSVTG